MNGRRQRELSAPGRAALALAVSGLVVACGAADPDAALQAFLDQELFGLPQDGYRRTATDVGRVLFAHDVDGAHRVTVIVADADVVDVELPSTSGWVVETFATCDRPSTRRRPTTNCTRRCGATVMAIVSARRS